MREELAQLRVRFVGQHEVVERERRRDERCQPLERMLGLPSRGRPHEVAVDRRVPSTRVSSRARSSDRRDVALGEREARGELARELLQLGPDGGAGAAPAYTAQAPLPERCPFGMRRGRQLDRVGAGRVLAGPAARDERPVAAVQSSSSIASTGTTGTATPSRASSRSSAAGRSRPIGTRPAASRRRRGDRRDGRFPPGRAARAPRSGASRSWRGERRRRPRRAAPALPRAHGGASAPRRRGAAGPPPSGGAARSPRRRLDDSGRHERATVVERGRDGDPEGLEHEPQQRRRTRSAARRRRGRSRAAIANWGSASAHQAAATTSSSPRVSPRRSRRRASGSSAGCGDSSSASTSATSRGRAPAGCRPRRRSAPPRRRSPDRPVRPTAPRSCSRYTANAIRSTSRSSRSSEPSVTPRPRRTSTGPATLPARSAIPAGPAAAAAGIVTVTLVGETNVTVPGSRRPPSRNTSTSAAAWAVSRSVGDALRERPAGPRDDRDDGEADAVAPDEEPGLGDGDVEPAGARGEVGAWQGQPHGARRGRGKHGREVPVAGPGRVAVDPGRA